jgi:hypothetical protein
MAGDSHTNFNSGAFGVGAFAGATTIAGALVAGVANLRAQRQERWHGWTPTQLIAALNLSEAFRKNDHRIMRAQRITIARLERERATVRAIRKLRN